MTTAPAIHPAPVVRAAAPEPIRRVLFLDFDGVIITPRSTSAMGAPKAVTADYRTFTKCDPLAIAVLLQLCAAGVKLVISSTWRKQPVQCRAILQNEALLAHLHPDWATRHDNWSIVDSRGRQIRDWLEQHPEVRSYRILDDDTDILPEQKLYYVQCDPWDGLGYRGMENLLTWAGVGHRGPKEAA